MKKRVYVGIYTVDVDMVSGQMEIISAGGECRNPSFLAVSESHLYAVEELECGGGLVTYDVHSDGRLERISRVGLTGSAYCHVTVLPGGKALAVSAYNSGGFVISPIVDGVVKEPVQEFSYTGKGVNPIRQEGPHTHSAWISPNGERLFVCDLGLDRIYIYRLLHTDGNDICDVMDKDIDKAGYSNSVENPGDSMSVEAMDDEAFGKERYIREGEVAYIQTPEGSGPRHLCFDKAKHIMYVVAELTSKVLAYRLDKDYDKAELIGEYPMLPKDYRGDNLAADIHISDDGRYVYASNRGHDSIATYEINEDGKLHFLSHGKCSAKEIRSFTLLADNRILIAGQSSDNLVCCEVNSSGRIGRQMSEIRIPRPVCVVKG